jgi:autotransporter-associated beta strand protein
MKTKHLIFPNLLSLALVMQASADVIYSNLQNIGIPATFDGLYLNVETGAWNTNMAAPVAGWDINPYYGGSVLANSPDFQPVRSGTGSSSAIVNLAAGASVGSGSVFSTFVQGVGGETPGAPGYGFSQMLTGSGGNFNASQEGYLGFRLNGTNYGSMRVVFTNNTSGAMIKDWAYDTSGASVVVGAIQQVGQDIILSSGFTLGSALNNSGGTTNLVKNGSSTNTLSNSNTYTGATAVNDGTLKIASTGSINTSSGVTVAAGAKFVYNSSTSLSVGTTLNGDTTANRAVLGGTGTIDISIILDNLGDTLSPGNSPGIQNYTAAQSWSSFSYDWEVNHFTGTTAGTDFDQISLGSTLNLSGGSGSYILNVIGLNALNESGLVPDFSEINRSWTILTSAGTLSVFNAANWTINTAGFTDPHTGSWALDQSGNNLVLSYTAVPEPGAALLGSLGLLMLLRRGRREKVRHHRPSRRYLKLL